MIATFHFWIVTLVSPKYFCHMSHMKIVRLLIEIHLRFKYLLMTHTPVYTIDRIHCLWTGISSLLNIYYANLCKEMQSCYTKNFYYTDYDVKIVKYLLTNVGKTNGRHLNLVSWRYCIFQMKILVICSFWLYIVLKRRIITLLVELSTLGTLSFLARLAKGHVSFCHHLSSVHRTS